MARYTFRLPDIGEGIAEAEIVAWHVKVGDRIEEDGRLADMMTDKATVEMESPVSGIVVEVAGEAGDVIAIGSALAVIEVEGEGEGAEPDVAERIDAENPDVGDVIQGSDDCRKVRWARAGTGKSGGVRVIHFNRFATGDIVPLLIYTKSACDSIGA